MSFIGVITFSDNCWWNLVVSVSNTLSDIPDIEMINIKGTRNSTIKLDRLHNGQHLFITFLIHYAKSSSPKTATTHLD